METLDPPVETFDGSGGCNPASWAMLPPVTTLDCMMPAVAFFPNRSSRRLVRPAAPGLVCLALAMLVGEARAALTFAPYPFETVRHGVIHAEVAYLDVPRRHREPDGPQLRLRVVRLPATGGERRAAPVVYLAGGPGGSGVGTARGPRWPVFDRIRREADVLLLDQRGTGLSAPPPDCPYTHHFEDGQPLERDAALAALRGTAGRCVAHWRATGVDLTAYTTAESAGDIEALRRAMGSPRISLWGMSYGTHLALATVRLHAAGIDRVVLMGAEGPDDTLKPPLSADALLAELSAIARRDGFDDLEGSARRVIAALREQPGQGRSLMHGGRQVSMGAFDAQLAIAAAIGRRSTQQMLPLALRRAENGDLDLLADLVLAVREQLGTFQAMPLAMDVASGHSPARLARVQDQSRSSLLGDALNFPWPGLGQGLGLTDLGDDFRAPIQSDTPALFVSGTLDGRTPPGNAWSLLPGFRHGGHLLVGGASHDDELWLGDAAIAEHMAAFLAGRPAGDVELRIAPPAFARNRGALLLATLGVGGATALTALVATLALPVVAFLAWRRRIRARRAGPQGV